ncbi:lipopolysaccharide biosynthesis protein [Aquimarina sp. LLG6339-5]|uniref:lipopolysaccharide biosynthesis protein n=1 Tax=Aquimarina sp. LLG6339-5 TaxID=3160830 RepID=UPI003865E66B
MKIRIPKLLTRVGSFTFFNLLNAAVPFLLLPILTNFLSPSDYGIIDLFNNAAVILAPIIGFSITKAIDRYYFDQETIKLKLFVSTTVLSHFKFGFIFIIFALIITFAFKSVFISFDLPVNLLFYAFLYAFFSQVSEIILILWRVSLNTVKYGLFRVFKTIMDAGISIFLITYLSFDWQGRVFPQLLAAFVFAGVSIFYLRREGYFVNLEIDKEYKRLALKFSVPLIFHSVSAFLIGFSDRFFVFYLLDLESLGIYSIGYQIGMVVGLLQNSFNQAWTPYFYGILKKDSLKEKIKIVKITYGYYILMILVVVFFYFATPYIYQFLIGEQFTSGIEVVIWVLIGYAFNGMYKMSVNYLFFLKETKKVAIITLIVALVNSILNYLFIKMNGIEGAAQATTISFLLQFVIVLIYSRKKYSMPWNIRNVFP